VEKRRHRRRRRRRRRRKWNLPLSRTGDLDFYNMLRSDSKEVSVKEEEKGKEKENRRRRRGYADIGELGE